MGKPSTKTAVARLSKPSGTSPSENGLASSASTSASAAPALATPPSAAAGQAVAEDDIRLRAYLKWETAGRPEGNDAFFWLEAERELHRESEASRASISRQ